MTVNTEAACCCEQVELERVRELCAVCRERNRSLIQVLHVVQGLYGYLPMEVQEIVAEEMGVPLSKVSGVVSFYALFTSQPRGEHTIQICLGTACYVRGGKKLVDRLCDILGVEVGETTPDRKFTFEIARWKTSCDTNSAIIGAETSGSSGLLWL